MGNEAISARESDPDDISAFGSHINVRGRGTGDCTKGRFEQQQVQYAQDQPVQVKTQLFKENSRSIIATNDSPDVGFSASINPYRGCEHGCIYCYARPTHEYFGFSGGLDFETKIFAKFDAPILLQKALMEKTWQPQVIGISGVTDCYQPLERELQITRKCLEVLSDFRNPVVIITKNHLVTRDLDILSTLARHNAVHVVLSITTLDKELARKMEPRASQPQMRLKAVERLSAAGISVSVNLSPVIPGLTDHEIPALLEAAAQSGACSANYNLVRLPYGVKDLFQNWLDEHYPLRKDKVLNRIRDIRGGKLNVSQFGSRMLGEGIHARQIAQVFKLYRHKYALDMPYPPLSIRHFRRADEKQLSLFPANFLPAAGSAE